MIAPRLKIKRPEAPPKVRPLRFILSHRHAAVPAEDVETIRAIPGLTIVAQAHNMLLVQGPGSLAAMQSAMQSLATWQVGQEQFYEKARS
jgi:hypothetical protein